MAHRYVPHSTGNSLGETSSIAYVQYWLICNDTNEQINTCYSKIEPQIGFKYQVSSKCAFSFDLHGHMTLINSFWYRRH